MPARFFLVTRTRGPRFQSGKPLEEQERWPDHARFMDAMVEEGFIALGGPIVATPDVLIVFRARDAQEIEDRLAEDPWNRSDLLRAVSIKEWHLRLGTLDHDG